jgi:hypothetical protein
MGEQADCLGAFFTVATKANVVLARRKQMSALIINDSWHPSP